MRITAILKGNKDSLGRRTVYIRLSEGRVRKFHATKMKVAKSDFEKGKVKPSHPNYLLYNSAIRKLIIEAESAFITNEDYPDADFNSYVKSCLNQWDKTKSWGTLKQIKGEAAKLSRFKTVRISQITPDFLAKYQQYCYSLGNSGNTVWKTFKFLRLILRKAVREKVIKNNPFDIFQMPRYKDPKKTYLTKDQIEIIESKSKGQFLICGTWFVIACYTGLRFSDLSTFDKKKIKNGRLNIYTTKTGEIVSMPVNGKLKTLFEKIDYKPLPYTNVHYNRLLKALGSLCELDELISSHVARHSFATMCASAGISPEVTAKFMGITNLKTVAVYYQLAGERMDSELARLF